MIQELTRMRRARNVILSSWLLNLVAEAEIIHVPKRKAATLRMSERWSLPSLPSTWILNTCPGKTKYIKAIKNVRRVSILRWRSILRCASFAYPQSWHLNEWYKLPRNQRTSPYVPKYKLFQVVFKNLCCPLVFYNVLLPLSLKCFLPFLHRGLSKFQICHF